jgi:acetyl-CoA carboxylase biotin carboxyl carrier protein
MTNKEIHDLIKLVNRLDLSEFKLRDGDFEMSIRTKLYDKRSKSEGQSIPVMAVSATPAVHHVPAEQTDAGTAPTSVAVPAADNSGQEGSDLVEVKSPIVGTFYRSPSPDKPPYLKVGDTIDVGTVVCIVEAMKLFNEIESEVSGKIVKVMVEDASPVQYDQVLFLVDPKG